jgi:hypothetical protein
VWRTPSFPVVYKGDRGGLIGGPPISEHHSMRLLLSRKNAAKEKIAMLSTHVEQIKFNGCIVLGLETCSTVYSQHFGEPGRKGGWGDCLLLDL